VSHAPSISSSLIWSSCDIWWSTSCEGPHYAVYCDSWALNAMITALHLFNA
jgi:hypothetical protein